MIEVILPTLNEEEGLPLVIKSFREQGIKNLVVVDGHSTDNTVEIARKNKAKVIMQEGEGKGMAFQTFLKKHPIKENNYYVMLDTDNSYDPKDIGRFVHELKDYEIVTGHRVTIRYNLKDVSHYLGNKLISVVALILFFRWNPDICTGYWGFRGSTLKRLNIKSGGFDLEANLFCQTVKKGISHKIIRIDYHKRVGMTKLKASDALLIIRRIIRERLSRN